MPITLPPISQTELASGSPNRFLPGTGTSVPAGLEAVLEFNGLEFNVRGNLDSIIVKSIDGLHGPDVRDSRDTNPQHHGETIYQSWYGGRTITLTLDLRAGNISKLRDLEQAVRYAFSDLEEHPLYFKMQNSTRNHYINCKSISAITGIESQEDNKVQREMLVTLRASNPRYLSTIQTSSSANIYASDDFSTNTIANYTFGIGGSSIAISGGQLVPSATTEIEFYRNAEALAIEDCQTTMKYTTGTSVATGPLIGLTQKRLDSSNYLLGQIEPSNASTRIKIYKKDTGSLTLLATSTTFTIASVTSYWLRMKVSGNVITVEHWTTAPPATGGSPTFTFSYTLTGGDATKFGTGTSGYVGIRTNAVPVNYRYDDFVVQPKKIPQIFTASNQGNFASEPSYTFSGGMPFPITLTNLSSEELVTLSAFSATTSIATGDSYVLSISDKTLVDSAGANKFAAFDVTSSMVQLEPVPEPNAFSLELGDYCSVGAAVLASWRGTWI